MYLPFCKDWGNDRNMTFGTYTFSFFPTFSPALMIPLAVILVLLSLFSLLRGGRGSLLRFLCGALLLFALLDPILFIEDRHGEKDVALLLVDRSPSNQLGQRKETTDKALKELKNRLEAFPDIEIKQQEFGRDKDYAENGTQLYDSWRQSLNDINPRRLAGTIILSDGQIHDPLIEKTQDAPTHLILTDDPDAKDRRLKILSSPGFGLIGKELEIRLRAEDLGGSPGEQVEMAMTLNGERLAPENLILGQDHQLHLKIEHPGQNILELSIPQGADEITSINNKAILAIQGIRDRLKVLLISGEPYPGERMWRNLLKSDPAVDLIHFTILRPPNKQDATPISELSLIAFPVDELFIDKLRDFDLIIFDRFQHLGVLPDDYFQGIIDYVKAGGAILEAEGPTSAGQFGLTRTYLGQILTAKPSGEIRSFGFKPTLSDVGHKHPVTANLLDYRTGEWGRWFRQIVADPGEGQTLLNGADQLPLLVLNRVEKGRVAQLLSDHLWMWQRGFEGGGPYSELIRRTMHWLMQEPELEEEHLKASIQDGQMIVTRQSLLHQPKSVSATLPNGEKREIKIEETKPGQAQGRMNISEDGLYRVSDGDKTAFAASGSLISREFDDPRASPLPLKKIIQESGGKIVVSSGLDSSLPKLRRTSEKGAQSGSDWIGLKRNNDYTVTGHKQAPLLPEGAALVIILSAALFTWWREGR